MEYNIIDFGASPNNMCNTKYIQAAIDECANAGGGKVIIPAGNFITGTIRLKSHVELYLERGSILKATEDLSEYNEFDEFTQNFQCKAEGWDGRHLILCVEQEDVAITGGGTVEGIGDLCYGGKLKVDSNCYWREGFYQNEDMNLLRRGILIFITESSHITVTDVKIQNSACWNLLFYGCDYVKVSRVTILNDKKHANSDGIDIDSCSFVTVSDCLLDVGDDCIAIRDAGYYLKNKDKPCQNITITNCVLSNSTCAIRIGVGVGSISYVTISDIVMARTGEGIVFATGFQNMGSVHIHDILVRNVVGNDVSCPLQMYANENVIERVTISGLHSNAALGIRLLSDKKWLKDIALRDVTVMDYEIDFPRPDLFEYERKGAIIRANGVERLTLDNVRAFLKDDYYNTRESVVKATNTEILRKDVQVVFKDKVSFEN